MATTYELLNQRRQLRDSTGSAAPSRNGYSVDYVHSRSTAALRPAVISDIEKNGFEVRCLQTGIVFTVRPDGSICRGMVQSLSREWFGTA